MNDLQPTFNLWTEPWITLERADGSMTTCGIAEALARAHEFVDIYEPSPLVVAGIHRLLTAVAQAIVNPQREPDLISAWQAGHFAEKGIADFGKQYAHRFDLFSMDAPFMQSADLPLKPAKGDKTKTIAYLAMELPAGTAVTHYRHGSDDECAFCPTCVAACLTGVPAFASSGGAGIKPSINGVPPIYVLPVGKTLFESLLLSLVIPDYQPEVRSRKRDDVTWLRSPVMKKAVRKGEEATTEVTEVGYLHSLTFLARRIRLHPEQLNGLCSRCGQRSEWAVRTMVFEMGESRPKDAPFWFDPFAAYRLPEEKGKAKKKDTPTPIRPNEGRATWREFGALFLQQSKDTQRFRRPSLIAQMADVRLVDDLQLQSFRCIGLRTDMKAKIFEWIDAQFDVPASVLSSEGAASTIYEGLNFSSECVGIIRSVFKEFFGGSGKDARKFDGLRTRMTDMYWSSLTAPFRAWVLDLAKADDKEAARKAWLTNVIQAARQAFQFASESIGDDAASLRKRVRGENKCNAMLIKKQKEYSE